jgi:hypothetical protein
MENAFLQLWRREPKLKLKLKPHRINENCGNCWQISFRLQGACQCFIWPKLVLAKKQLYCVTLSVTEGNLAWLLKPVSAVVRRSWPFPYPWCKWWRKMQMQSVYGAEQVSPNRNHNRNRRKNNHQTKCNQQVYRAAIDTTSKLRKRNKV